VEDDDLAAGLAELSTLLTGHRPLTETLTEIAGFAVHAIPGAEGAGLAMLEDGRAQTVVASAAFAHAVDDVQYGLGEGPCLLAVAERRTQLSGSLGGETRWPRFGPRVGRMGVHSVLSLPLLLPDGWWGRSASTPMQGRVRAGCGADRGAVRPAGGSVGAQRAGPRWVAASRRPTR